MDAVDQLRSQQIQVRAERQQIPALRTCSIEAGTGQNGKCMTSKRLRTVSFATPLALGLLD